MRTYINVQRKKTIWRKLHQYSGLLLFSLILTACSQGSDPQQGVISGDKLSAPFPKAITPLLVDDAKLIVHVVVNGDTGNPFRVENLVANTTAGTFSGNVPGFSAGTYTLSLVYSINDSAQGTVEIIKTSDITVTVVANENTPANFSSAEMTYTDTDGDSFSNLDELKAGASIIIPNYTVGGQIEGLTGTGLILQNNGSDNLAISANSTFSTFTFSPTAIDSDEYAVSVLAQPGNPDQTCIVNNGNGRISGIAVSNVSVICSTTSYTVSGTVSGYTGSGLVLQNNDGDDLPVSASGAFSFSSALADGSGYAVSVRTQPGSPNQVCTVNNGHGTVSGATVSSVAIICSADSYTVGGTVSGDADSGLVLQNNGSDNLAINAGGNFTFSNAVANGSNYIVTVLTQPDDLNRICTVSNGSGTVDSAPVSSVSVICSANTAPAAINVAISDVNGGNTAVGNLLSGIYTYIDTESDPEGASTFRWLADSVAIAGATTSSYVPVAGDIGKTITFEVTPVATAGVTTGAAASSAGLVTEPNSPPFFTSGLAISVAEDIIATGYTATAQDPDGDTVTFSLSGGADREAFSIDSDSGVLGFNILTRFKTPADSDGNNTYVVEITATDGNHSISRSVAVIVTMAILEISVSTADIKTVRFEWPAYPDATNYKLFVNPDSTSGYSLLQDSFPETGIAITLPVHLTDWINARYILEAYNASGRLTESSPVSITPLMLSSIGYVKASNTGAGDRFGGDVSLSADSNTLAVSARWEDSVATGVNGGGGGDNTANNSGAVYVFSRNDDGNWSQQAYVKASNTGAGDSFGSAVSLSADGNTLAVGALFEDSAATGISIDGSGEADNTANNSGAVYVFSRNDDGVWGQQAYVKASNTGEDDWFGYAVSLSGDGSTLAVGASWEDSAITGVSTGGSGEGDNVASDSGAVYVFSRNDDGVWGQQAYVKASNTGANDGFGYAVNLSGDGNTLAVGASREDSAITGVSTDGSGEGDNTASYSGAVYVFGRNGNTWGQQAYVKASNTGTDDRFGSAVSLSGDGNMLVVGAVWEDSTATGISADGSGEDDNMASSSGAVYVFGRNGEIWGQQAYIKASDTDANDYFGYAVSLSGDGNILAVGASQANRTGAVYVFGRNGAVWSQQSRVVASNIERDDGFGGVVSLSGDGNMLAVGASGEKSAATGISTGGGSSAVDNSASRAGAVYLY